MFPHKQMVESQATQSFLMLPLPKNRKSLAWASDAISHQSAINPLENPLNLLLDTILKNIQIIPLASINLTKPIVPHPFLSIFIFLITDRDTMIFNHHNFIEINIMIFSEKIQYSLPHLPFIYLLFAFS